MNAIVPATFGAVSTRFATQQPVDDLSSGIQSSFGLIGYKGKVWSIRYRGDETPLMRDDGDGPRGSIEVVILKASQQVSKIWYKDGYVEGSNQAPDCFSNNGVAPDPTATNKQCASCAVCPHNQWGSRVTPAGKQGKACSDSKRLAVVPQGDINNEAFGGPMLLRVPAASLQDLASFGQKMQQMGYPYYAIATKISFDPAESYPKFAFSALRPLTDPEADLVLSLRDGHQVTRILSDNEFSATPVAASAAQPEQVFEQQATQPQQSNGFGTAQAQTPVETPEQKAMREMQAEMARLKAAAEAAAKPVETPEQKAMREMQAEMERLRAAAAAAAAAQPVETPEQKQMREMKEEMERLRAAAAAAQQTTAAPAVQQVAPPVEPVTTEVTVGNGAGAAATTQTAQATPASATEQAAPVTASPSDANTSAFEANLDEMLDQLLS